MSENSALRFVRLPESMVEGYTYQHLFDFFLGLEEPIIPLALYRAAGALDNKIPYVYTNPQPNSPIFVCFFFILFKSLKLLIQKFDRKVIW